MARVVIGQRERTIALRPTESGLVAHTLLEQGDINDAKAAFDDAAEIKTDQEMVKLATQLIDRQTSRYDSADLEDRYETRLPRRQSEPPRRRPLNLPAADHEIHCEVCLHEEGRLIALRRWLTKEIVG
jgi:hypothetical protein